LLGARRAPLVLFENSANAGDIRSWLFIMASKRKRTDALPGFESSSPIITSDTDDTTEIDNSAKTHANHLIDGVAMEAFQAFCTKYGGQFQSHAMMPSKFVNLCAYALLFVKLGFFKLPFFSFDSFALMYPSFEKTAFLNRLCYHIWAKFQAKINPTSAPQDDVLNFDRIKTICNNNWFIAKIMVEEPIIFWAELNSMKTGPVIASMVMPNVRIDGEVEISEIPFVIGWLLFRLTKISKELFSNPPCPCS
jgi:hypothetical protein